MSKQQKQKRQKQRNQKQNQNSHAPIGAIISVEKRSELEVQVKNLWQLATIKLLNPKEEWENYVQIQAVLQKIIELENLISPSLQLSEKATTAGTTLEALRMINIECFNKWLLENDVKCDGFNITEFGGFGLGIKTELNIQEGDIMFSIPRKIMLNEEILVEQQDGLSGINNNLMTNLKLAYTLCIEALKGDASFWKPYLDILPVVYNTALYFTLDEMEELKGSNVLSSALSHIRSIVRRYAGLYLCAQSAPASQTMTETGKLMKEKLCFDLYRWAVATVTTRQNQIPRKGIEEAKKPEDFLSTLIPFWDMINHKEGKITTFYEPAQEAIVSSAQFDFKAGEQIFMHYGNRPNSELLIHNGFIDPKNKHDYVNIKLGLSTSDPLLEKRTQILNLLEIPVSGCDLAVYPAPDFISGKLLAFVRVFNMNEAQLDHWNHADHAKDLLYLDCALETELESKTWKYLQTRLMLLLRVFPTTLQADETKLNEYRAGAIELSYRKAMILEYRILEKRILTDALEYVTQRSKA